MESDAGFRKWTPNTLPCPSRIRVYQARRRDTSSVVLRFLCAGSFLGRTVKRQTPYLLVKCSDLRLGEHHEFAF